MGVMQMSREQKFAWYIVAVFGLTVVCVVALWVLAGTAVAPAGVAVFALAALGPLLLGKKSQDSAEPDERDRVIAEKATLRGAMASYGGMGVVCFVIWCVQHARGNETMPIRALPYILIVAMMVLVVGRSVALLVLYACGGADGQK